MNVKIGDVALNYTVHGQGDWLVLIGGLAGGNWQSWAGQIPRLAARYKVLAFDNRGIGESDSPDYPYTTRMMASDTLSLMDALGIQRAHVFGKSLGGAIGQMMALEAPERVRSLVMTSTFARLDPRGVRILETWRNSVRHCGWQQFARELLAHFFTAEFFEQHPEAVARAEKALIETKRTLHGYMHSSDAVQSHDSWSHLSRIRTPTFLLCGAEDLITPPRQSEAMARRIAGSEVFIVPQSLHGFLAERPQSVDAILEFLGRH
ncbi:MAG: alpha/beta fold hydrolase [Betaproteobacteria bacterium]